MGWLMKNFCLFPKLDNKNLHSSSAATQSDPFVSFVCLKLFISASGRRFVDVIQRGLIVRGDIESFESFLDFISDKNLDSENNSKIALINHF